MAEENGDVIFIKVDVDDNEETSEACGIEGMPTFQFYKGGEKLDQIVGASEPKLLEYVNKYKDVAGETTGDEIV